MHPGAVPPQEKWLFRLVGTGHKVESFGGYLHIDRFHPLLGQRAGIFDFPISATADHTTWTKFLFKGRIFRVVRMLGLLLGIQVIKVTEKLIKSMVGWQHFVAVTQMVFAELSGHITFRLQHGRYSRIFFFHAFGGSGKTHLGKARAHRRLPGDECRASCGAALLTIPVSKQGSFVSNPVNVRCLIAHRATVVGADVKSSDIVTPNNQDVGFFCSRCQCGQHTCCRPS